MTLSYYCHKMRELLGQAATDSEMADGGYVTLLTLMTDEMNERHNAVTDPGPDDDEPDGDGTDLYDETGDVVA